MRDQYYLRKSFGPLSSGTRVELLHREKGSKYAMVRLMNKPSEKMQQQKHPLIKEMGRLGLFQCPVELLVERRNRVTRHINPSSRASETSES